MLFQTINVIVFYYHVYIYMYMCIFHIPEFPRISWNFLISRKLPVNVHTRFNGTNGASILLRIFTYFPCYRPSCCAFNIMHFPTSVIILVDQFTWSYLFGLILQINRIPKAYKLWYIIWRNSVKIGKCRLKSGNFRKLVCLYLGYYGN